MMKPPPLTARIISIGDELLQRRTVNSNGGELSAGLHELGVRVTKIVAVGDEEGGIVKEVLDCREDILLMTGGLGPTQDDLTVAAVARSFEEGVIIDPDHLAYLEKIRHRRHLPERFLRQAAIPRGFVVEKSPFGTAPFLYRIRNDNTPLNRFRGGPRLCVLLPGVPFECLSLFRKKVIPLIKKIFPEVGASGMVQELKIISVPESRVEEALEKIREPEDGMEVAFLPSLGELLIRLKYLSHLSHPSHPSERSAYLRKVSRKLMTAFRDHQSYAAPGNRPIPSVVERLHQFLVSQGWRVGFAESCTGGLLTAGFVHFPGSSAYLDSGAITYSNQAKSDLCGVKPTTLKQFGAVSSEVAQEMAAGIAQRRKLHLSVSITGIAGPGGGSAQKPIGLVYIGLYFHPPRSRPRLLSQRFLFPARGFAKENRRRIQEQAVKNALFMMMEVCFPKKNVFE